MRSRLLTLTLAVLLVGLIAPPAFATHFDNTTTTGSFNPQYTVTFAGDPLVNRVGDLTIKATQADHEDPVVYAELPVPGAWQFPMADVRPGETPLAAATTECDDVMDGDDDGVIANQTPARAEKIGIAHAEVAANGIGRPPPPLVYDGDFLFIAWDALNSRARLCFAVQTADARLSNLPPDIPTEDVAELRLDFWLPLVQNAQGELVWAAPLDLRDLIQDQVVQSLEVSILDVTLSIFGHSPGNWHAGGIDVSKAPATSGTYNFPGYFQTCPANDPEYGFCKSGRPDVTRNNTIPIGLPAPAITSPADGAFINTHGTSITGTSDPNATVRIFTNGSPLGDVTADASGVWDTAGTMSLAEGEYTVTARTIDAGGQSPASNSRSFTIDTPPLPPTIGSPAEGTTFGQGEVALSGSGQAGSTVRIYEGTDLLGSTVAGPGGAWSKSVTMTLKGPHTLTATSADLGGEGDPSLPVGINITTATPAFTAPVDGSHVNSLSIDVAGTAEPGATVAITQDGLAVGSPVADSGGVFTLPLTLPEGEYTFGAVSTSEGFTSLDAVPVTVTIDVTAPGAPVIASPADGSVVDVRSVPFSGTGEPNATIVLRNGATEIGTATVGEDGSWSKSIVLPDGLYTVDSIARDRAGNESAASLSTSFEVDVPVLITTPAQDSMNPKLTTITVVGDPAATQARVFKGTTEIGRAAMNNGTAVLKLNFATGSHTITARTVSSGQLGKSSAERTFQVDATGPAVAITGAGGATPSVVMPGDLVSGTADDLGAAISGVASVDVVFSDERNVFVTKASATCSGCPAGSVAWSIVPSEVVSRPGIYNISVTATDVMGNVSAAKRAKILVVTPTL